jgi:hypothetical protein
MGDGASDGTATGIRRRSLLGGAIGAVSMVGLGLAGTAAPAAAANRGDLVMIRYNGDVIKPREGPTVLGSAPNARLVSSLDHESFLEVTDIGNLYEHVWDPNRYRFDAYLRGWGFTAANTRLIAGLSHYQFLEIGTEGNLSLWSRKFSGDPWREQVRGSGWGPNNTRLITGITENEFLEVQANGDLSLWYWTGTMYYEYRLPGSGFTAANTRQVSGIGSSRPYWLSFYELTAESTLSTWTYEGASLVEENWPPTDVSDVRLMA